MQQVINALTLGSIYLLFSLGLTLAWGTLKVLNLAHGAVFVFSSLIGFLATRSIGLPFPLVVALGMLSGGLMTLLIDAVVFRRVRRIARDELQAELLMLAASLGVAAMLLSFTRNVTLETPSFGLTPGTFTTVLYQIGAAKVSNIQFIIIGLGIGMVVALALWVRHSRAGRALRALAFDPATCGLMGVNATALSATAMVIAGAMAGLAGILLIVYLGAIGPESGESLMLKAFSIIVLGGVGSIWGALIGAFFLAGAESVVLNFTSGGYVDAIAFAMIILVLLFRPRGLIPVQKAERV